MCKICKKHLIVYLALFIWYNFFFLFWRELNCKFLQGYLKPRLNKLTKKKKKEKTDNMEVRWQLKDNCGLRFLKITVILAAFSLVEKKD